MILNKTLCFWLIDKFDHYKGLLGFFIVTGFLHTAASSVLHAVFYQSQEDKREREWMSKQCQKLRSKVKEGFREIIYIYIYTLYHVAYCHSIPSTVLFSLQISEYYWFVFVWPCVLCLIFTIQHILTKFFLSEFSFESFIILFVAVFIYRPTATFQS